MKDSVDRNEKVERQHGKIKVDGRRSILMVLNLSASMGLFDHS